MRTMSYADWMKEGIRRFGPDQMGWRFVCPSCGHIASLQDWKDAGASSRQAAFSCVGRYLNDPVVSKNTFKNTGGPCDYAGGGLIGLNPVEIVMEGERNTRVFEFAGA